MKSIKIGPCNRMVPTDKIYVQPDKQQIYRPAINFPRPQNAKLENNSIYRQSYKQPANAPQCTRPGAPPSRSPWLTDARADLLTEHRTSFPAWPGARPRQAVLPRDHEVSCSNGGCGPMQAVTSQRHDYAAKRLAADDRSRTAWPTVHLGVDGWCSVPDGGRCPMDDTTTTAETFDTPSARPSTADVWSAADVRMAGQTESSSSYRPWDDGAMARTPCPRCAVAEYRPPVEAVSDCTEYARSYGPPGVFRDPLPGQLLPAVSRPDDAGRLTTVYPRAHHYHLQ